jgi:amino acid transporter
LKCPNGYDEGRGLSYGNRQVGEAVSSSPAEDRPVRAQLGVWDAASIIVGIIIGVGIVRTPAMIFNSVPGPWEALGLWAVGGLLALVGALCFAELGSTYPRSGGEYVYLTRAFGRGVGFFFAWGQLIAIRSGASIVAVAYVFGEYARGVLGTPPSTTAAYACTAIILLTATNILGVRLGKQTQNTLTVAKVLGLVCVVVVGFAWPNPVPTAVPAAARTIGLLGSGMGQGPLLATSSLPALFPAAPALALAGAMIAIFWTYAGWHEAGYVAAEVRDRKRNLPRALILGTVLVTGIYLLVNAAYVVGLGFDRARTSPTIAADLLGRALGANGARFISVLVIVSSLGAINGMTLTSSRIFVEFGADHALFAALARWNRRLGTPVRSLVTQAAVCLLTILAVELLTDSNTRAESFDYLVAATAPVFWLFFLLTGFALFVLRHKDAGLVRPFSVPLYPALPILYCVCCAAMLVASLLYAVANPQRLWMTGLVLVVLFAGVPLYLFSSRFLAKQVPPLPGAPGPVALPSAQESTSFPG